MAINSNTQCTVRLVCSDDRPAHLLSSSLPGVANELLKSVTDFVILMLNDEMYDYISDVIFGGTLIALQKKNGGIDQSSNW